jgi:aminoglycoside phosphotransferase (APT) family kinase protein
MADEDALIEELRVRTAEAAQSWQPGAGVVGIEPLTGGASSLTFTVNFEGVPEEDRVLVLKVAPPGLEPLRNRDVLRQGRVMRALKDRPGVPVPELRFEDAGAPPAVPPFLAMNLLPGECFEPALSDERYPARFAEFRERAFDAAQVLAAMHRLVPAEIGLGDEPVMAVSAEIGRWTRAFTTVPTELQHNYEEVAAALEASIPPPVRPVVDHGDYRLGNTLCEGGRLRAIIDWEIWSVGDPRIDLTWMTFFCDDAQHPSQQNPAPSGMPEGAELLGAYVEASGEDYPDMEWFNALTYYKEAGASALLLKRAMKRPERMVGSTIASMIPGLQILLDKAMEILSS